MGNFVVLIIDNLVIDSRGEVHSRAVGPSGINLIYTLYIRTSKIYIFIGKYFEHRNIVESTKNE